jgi:hypothetical protein
VPTSGASLFFIAERHTIWLHEIARPEDQGSVYRLQIDGIERGDLDLPGWLLPSVAAGPNGIAVWGSCDCYLVGFGGGEPLGFPQDDEVFNAFPLDDSWLLLLELGAVRVDATSSAVLARYDHHEIFFFERWTDQGVVLKDWNQEEVILDPYTLKRLS